MTENFGAAAQGSNFNHVPPSFSYRIEQCSNSSKFLVQEKIRTRNDDRRPSFLDQISRSSFSYEKLGSSVRGLSAAKRPSVRPHL